MSPKVMHWHSGTLVVRSARACQEEVAGEPKLQETITGAIVCGTVRSVA